MRIIVVGAGIVGSAIAHELARRGAQVRVVDMRGAGRGATQASAGILAPYIEGHCERLLQIGVRSLILYDEFVSRVETDAGLSVEYDRSGSLQVSLDDRGTSALESAAQRLEQLGVAHTLVSTDGVRTLEPLLTPAVQAGLLVPQHGYVRVAQLTSALSAAAAKHGAMTITTMVRRVHTSGSVMSVDTSEDLLEADAVVLAAGSWTSALVDPVVTPPPVRPIRGQLLEVQFRHRPLSRVVWGPDCYLVPWRDGSMLIGATVEDVGFDEAATSAGVEGLLRQGAALLTVAPAARFEGVRVGLRPGTPDELPLIGPSSTTRGLYYASGHYRNGVLLAPLTATLVADMVLEDRRAPELDLVRPDRFGL